MVTDTKIRLAILDFDGTIADTQTLIVDTMQGVIEELGLEKRTRAQCAAMIGLPLEKTFSTLIPMSDEMNRRCAEAYERIYREKNTLGAVTLFPHVYETLEKLHAHGTVLTIASSRHRWSLIDFVERFGIEKFITYILGADDVTHAKPHPRTCTENAARAALYPRRGISRGRYRLRH